MEKNMTPSPEREKLAAAIARQADAQRLLDEAKAAAQHARAQWSAVNERVGSIGRQIEESEASAETSTDAFVASLAAGSDLAVLDRPANTLDGLRAQLEAAEQEATKWRQAQSVAEQAVESRRQALDLAEHIVDASARRVVGADVNVGALLSACAVLRNELLDAQSKIAAIAASVDHASDLRKRLDVFLADDWLIDAAWRDRPAAQAIKDTFAALKADADASVPLKVS
jgi:chromosome segregation ATPase